MDGKKVGAIITAILMVPLLISLIVWNFNISKDPGKSENIEKGAEITADSVIPWWIGIFEWLAGLPGIIGAVLIIGFIFFLKWIGEIR